MEHAGKNWVIEVWLRGALAPVRRERTRTEIEARAWEARFIHERDSNSWTHRIVVWYDEPHTIVNGET